MGPDVVVSGPEIAIFEAKRQRRLELARLPIERKLGILLVLQRMANDVRRAAGRPTRPEWPRELGPSETRRPG
ncbi:MAG: hypothetical protein EDX89_15295 [Acidobacteria bacterium]|nr:MAG: hypothetical protein EDX89_15295 [Acidobacteriota bacterium]MCE7956614.1 hypothetical protein [Acidobacteria bacterium ACB2]